jgi:uncharacterized membrane protein
MKFNLDPGKIIGGLAGIVIPHLLGSHGYVCLPMVFHFILPSATCVLGAYIGHYIYVWIKAEEIKKDQ